MSHGRLSVKTAAGAIRLCARIMAELPFETATATSDHARLLGV
jgi:hypothetical protein